MNIVTRGKRKKIKLKDFISYVYHVIIITSFYLKQIFYSRHCNPNVCHAHSICD